MNDWKAEFEKLCEHEEVYNCSAHDEGQYCCLDKEHARHKEIQAFIESTLKSQREELLETLEKNIGFMRQWLNEDRITDPKKMVKNEELKVWLEELLNKLKDI